MLMNTQDRGGVTILTLISRRLNASALPQLIDARDSMLHRGRSAMIVDLSKLRGLSFAGLGALLEFASTFGPSRLLAFCGATKSVLARLDHCNFTDRVPYFASLPHALASTGFKSQRLNGHKTLILCAGEGRRMAPLTRTRPKPMLELFGTPVLSHLLRHLSTFGLNDILLNPGHLGDQISSNLDTGPDQRLQFYREGRMTPAGWQGQPIGSASTLARLQHQHSTFLNDTIVLCGDAVIDLDLAAMMQAHQDSGADVTIAAMRVPRADRGKYGILETDGQGRILNIQEKPKPDEALGDLASVGIYIFKPAALAHMSDAPDQDIAQHLLPSILAKGGHIHAFTPAFEWIDLGCPRDYVQAHFKALRGETTALKPPVSERKPLLWVDNTARISRRAQIKGPCYIGPNVEVSAGVEINGPCVISANCVLDRGSLLSDCFVLPDTWVQSGAWVNGQLVAPTWALPYATATGHATPLADSPLDRVQSTKKAHGAHRFGKIVGVGS